MWIDGNPGRPFDREAKYPATYGRERNACSVIRHDPVRIC